jgi:hypothetical protein
VSQDEAERVGRTVRERKPFLLRLDPEVHDALRSWAADDFRSLNAQIEFVLRNALRDAGRLRGRGGGGTGGRRGGSAGRDAP